MKEKQNILVLSYSPLHRDPRVRRQIFSLKKRYNITAAGLTDPKIDEIKFIEIGCKKRFLPKWLIIHITIWAKRLKLYDILYWKNGKLFDLKRLRKEQYDLILANDLDALPIAHALPGQPKIIIDMHEYFPRYREHDNFWKINQQEETIYRCRKYLKKADAITTVCNGLAEQYRREICQRDIKVIRNCSPFFNLEPTPVEDKIAIIHHGISLRRRRIEQMILAMDHVDKRFCLDLMLVNIDNNYFEFLNTMAEERTNVTLIDPVLPDEIVPYLNKYDIGLFLLEPITFNLKMALPNKLFEFIQARLAVIIGPSSEMQAIVNRYSCGAVSPDFSPESCASLLNSLSNEDISVMKCRSAEAAKIENFEKEREKLNIIINNLLKQ
jgi:hypothetical protein